MPILQFFSIICHCCWWFINCDWWFIYCDWWFIYCDWPVLDWLLL